MSKQTNGWIRKERRLALYLRDRFTCLYCGSDLRNVEPSEITLDHLVPRSANGSNDNDNLVTACRHCNCSRQDKPWVDFAPGGARDRIQTQRYAAVNVKLAQALIAGTAGDAEVEAQR